MVSKADDVANVVIVEDCAGLAELFSGWLEKTYRVTVAGDCETAYELLDETVDVALLDRNLPDGTGVEVLEHIRDAGYDCQVGMVTAIEPSLDIIQMGFTDYLCKPATREELQRTVKRLIAHASYEDAVRELHTLASKKALLEANCTAAALEASEEYTALERRIEERNTELATLVDRFSERQFAAQHSQLEAHSADD